MPRRKPRLYPDLSRNPVEPPVHVRRMHDPQEVSFYVKQLKKALKFLPLGSRAYYYVSGEILRANTQLKLIVSLGPADGQGHDSAGSPSDSNEEN